MSNMTDEQQQGTEGAEDAVPPPEPQEPPEGEQPPEGEKPEEKPTPDPEPAEKSPYLTAAKMLPIEGVVYCLTHNAVHDDTTDPYKNGSEDCTKKEHRTIYYRGRKGDYDETQDAEPTERRVIAASQHDELTDEERSLARRLVERERNKAEVAFAEMREIIGVGDLSAAEATLDVLASAQRKLNGGTQV